MQFSDFILFDIVVISIVFFSVLFAFLKGFIHSFFSFLSWLSAAILSYLLVPDLLGFLPPGYKDSGVIISLYYIAVFIVLWVLFAIIFFRMARVFKAVHKGVLDRTFGVMFGLIRGIFIVCLIFFTVTIVFAFVYPEKDQKTGPEWLVQAKLYNSLDLSTEFILSLFPQQANFYVRTLVQRLEGVSVHMDSLQPGKHDQFTQKEKILMKQVIASLPEHQVDRLHDQYGGDTDALSKEERMEIFAEIFQLYLQAEQQGSIFPQDRLTEDEKKSLQRLFSPITPTDKKETAYEKGNIRSFERLVDSIE